MIYKIINENQKTISPLVNIPQVMYILDNLIETLTLTGDVVELACNIGTTSLYIRRLLNAVNSDKTFHVYDSFQGLPEPLEIDGDLCKQGDMKKEQHEFEQSFVDAGLECPVVNKGWFCDIPDDQYPEKICFAFFDGDFYSSIIDSFYKVYDKMVPGGIILIHDYAGEMLPGVKFACDDFLKDKPEKVIDLFWGIAKIIKL